MLISVNKLTAHTISNYVDFFWFLFKNTRHAMSLALCIMILLFKSTIHKVIDCYFNTFFLHIKLTLKTPCVLRL